MEVSLFRQYTITEHRCYRYLHCSVFSRWSLLVTGVCRYRLWIFIHQHLRQTNNFEIRVRSKSSLLNSFLYHSCFSDVITGITAVANHAAIRPPISSVSGISGNLPLVAISPYLNRTSCVFVGLWSFWYCSCAWPVDIGGADGCFVSPWWDKQWSLLHTEDHILVSMAILTLCNLSSHITVKSSCRIASFYFHCLCFVAIFSFHFFCAMKDSLPSCKCFAVANPYTPYGPGVRGETVTIGGNPTYPTYNYQPSQPPHSGAGQSAPAPPPAYNELYKWMSLFRECYLCVDLIFCSQSPFYLTYFQSVYFPKFWVFFLPAWCDFWPPVFGSWSSWLLATCVLFWSFCGCTA